MQGLHTCHCCRSFRSKAALDGHRATTHGEASPVYKFCPADAICLCCLVQFDNRKLLEHHLRYRGGWVCLLNAAIWNSPLSEEEVLKFRAADRKVEAFNEKRGLPRYFAEFGAQRYYVPLRRLVGVDGQTIEIGSNLHPFGPKRKKYQRADSESEGDSDS